MEQNALKEVEISNVFDYSNMVVDVETISTLVKYCCSCYDQFMKMCENDEERNRKLKIEYQVFQYKKVYGTKFEVTIKEKGHLLSNLTCKTYDSYIETVNSGHLKNVEGVTITLDLSFKRGKYMDLNEHENVFTIVFNPYDITFTRKSNYDDPIMNQVENSFNELLKKFRVLNTIFCTK